MPSSDIVDTSAIGLGMTEPIKNFFFSLSVNCSGEKSSMISAPYISSLGSDFSYSGLKCSYCSGSFSEVPSSDLSSSTSNPGPSVANSNTTLPFRSEEHTSELQSRFDLVCRLLLEKKKNTQL